MIERSGIAIAVKRPFKRGFITRFFGLQRQIFAWLPEQSGIIGHLEVVEIGIKCGAEKHHTRFVFNRSDRSRGIGDGGYFGGFARGGGCCFHDVAILIFKNDVLLVGRAFHVLQLVVGVVGKIPRCFPDDVVVAVVGLFGVGHKAVPVEIKLINVFVVLIRLC